MPRMYRLELVARACDKFLYGFKGAPSARQTAGAGIWRGFAQKVQRTREGREAEHPEVTPSW